MQEEMRSPMKFGLSRLFKIVLVIVILQFVFGPEQLSIAHGQSASPKIFLPLVINNGNENTNPVHQGRATWYTVAEMGTCSFDLAPDDRLVAAMNDEEWDNAAYCGAYLQVTGPDGEVTVRIVNRCRDAICTAGHLDLSYEAFGLIAEHVVGIVPITWQVVSPPIDDPIVYHFKEGSSQYWTAIQIRNHRNPIKKFEYSPSPGQWAEVPRTFYNYFVQAGPDMGLGPYTFRVTDWYGNVLTDSGIPLIEDGSISGTGQFPPGP